MEGGGAETARRLWTPVGLRPDVEHAAATDQQRIDHELHELAITVDDCADKRTRRQG